MECTRSELEKIVIGTLLNDYGDDGFIRKNSMSLKEELFSCRQNLFIFRIIMMMYKDGLKDMTPVSVFDYANTNHINYGNAGRFVAYMCELATSYYAFNKFKEYLKELVRIYINEKKNGKAE